MDLSFSHPSPVAEPIAPPRDAAAVLAALATYRCTVHAAGRDLLAPVDGAFNGHVARLLCAAFPAAGSSGRQY